MRKKISQREARRNLKSLKEANAELVALTNRFRSDYPGVVVLSLTLQEQHNTLLQLTQRLGFALVVKQKGSGIDIYAVRK